MKTQAQIYMDYQNACSQASSLEQIARNTEVIETGLYIESYEDKVNFILADLAAG